MEEDLSYDILLYYNHWKFLISDNKFSLYHTNIEVTDNYTGYLSLFKSVKTYLNKRGKESEGMNCISIYNVKRNRNIVVHKNELKGFYFFLNTILNHVELIQRHTNNFFYSSVNTPELKQQIEFAGTKTKLFLN